MKYSIKKVDNKELDRAFLLMWDTFMEFVAPDYSKKGIETFRVKFIESEDFKECFKNGKQMMYGAYVKGKLVGVVSISVNSMISCFLWIKNIIEKVLEKCYLIMLLQN